MARSGISSLQDQMRGPSCSPLPVPLALADGRTGSAGYLTSGVAPMWLTAGRYLRGTWTAALGEYFVLGAVWRRDDAGW